MFGITTPKIKDAIINPLAKATRDQVLGSIPGYDTGASIWRSVRDLQRRSKPKSESNTVTEAEFNDTKEKLARKLRGTWNPITWVLGFFKSFFGDSLEKRLDDAISNFDAYSRLNDSYRFAREGVGFCLDMLEARVAKRQSIFAKIFGYKSSAVTEDIVIPKLKNLFQNWLESYNDVLKGEIPEVGWLSPNQIIFLQELRSRVQYGSASKYLSDLAPTIQTIIDSARSKLANTGQEAVTDRGRAVGENLSKPRQAA